MIQSYAHPFKTISIRIPTRGRAAEEIVQLVEALQDVIWRWVERGGYDVDEIEECEEGEGE